MSDTSRVRQLVHFVPMDRRSTSAVEVREHAEGAVLFADISGFSQLTRQLTDALGLRDGAEALSRHLDRIFGPLVDQVHRHRGSVIAFAGDAITCWFADEEEVSSADRAVATALAMQTTMADVASVNVSSEIEVPMSIKVAVHGGTVRRFVVGDPDDMVLDVLAGAVMDELEALEGTAERGDVVISGAVLAQTTDVEVKEERTTDTGHPVHVVTAGGAAPATGWAHDEAIPDEAGRGWLPGAIADRIASGQQEFIAELRRCVPLFLRFDGIDFHNDPEAGDKLDRYVRWVQRELARVGGTLLQLSTGDKGSYLFAAFGAVRAHEDDVERALLAARSLHAPPDELGFTPRAQIGVSRGRLFAGAYGSARRSTFTALGGETNVAARLMSRAAPGETLVTEEVRALAEDVSVFDDRGEVSLKGHEGPFQLWAASAGASPDPTAPAQPSAHIVVGREDALDQLRIRARAVLDGANAVVVIEGAAGVGKTHLLEAFLRDLPDGLVSSRGAADSIDHATPFLAWRGPLEHLCGAHPDPARLQQTLQTHAPSRGDLLPLLGDVMRVPVEDTALTAQLTGRLRVDNTIDLLTELLISAANQSPWLVVLEDLHWLDAASWVLLRRVAQEIPRILVLATTRPIDLTEYQELQALEHVHPLPLSAFGPEHTEDLVAAHLGVSEVPGELLDLVMAKTKGHPYFSIITLDALVQRELLEVRNGVAVLAWGAAEQSLDIGDTIEGALVSQLDALPTREQLVLKVASVIGSTFADRLLGDVHPVAEDRPTLPQHLSELADRDFVAPEALEEPSHHFQHEILREVAYGLLLGQQRQRLHRAVAEWIEERAAGQLDAWLPRLAYHWSRAVGTADTFDAEAAERAVRALAAAADQSLAAFANQQAVRFYQEALALRTTLNPGEPGDFATSDIGLERARYELGMSEAHQGMGDLGGCQKHAKLGLVELGRPIPDGDGMRMASTVWQTVRRRLPRVLLTEEDASEHGLQSAQIQARLYIAVARTYYHTNEASGSLYANAHKLRQAERLGPSPALAEAYCGVALILGLFQMSDRAEALFTEAIEMADEAGVRTMMVTARVIESAYLIGAGKTEKLFSQMADARAICEELGDHDQWGDCVGLMADASLLIGDRERANRLYEEIRARALAKNNHLHQLWALRGGAVMALREHRPDDAVRMLDHALVLLEQTVDQHTRIDMIGLLAKAHLQREAWSLAYQRAVEAADLIGQVQTPTAYAQYLGYAAVAEVFGALDDRRRADAGSAVADDIAARTAQSIKDLDKYGGVFQIGKPQADRFRGLAWARDGKDRAARKAWEKGLETAQTLGLPLEVDALTSLLA